MVASVVCVDDVGVIIHLVWTLSWSFLTEVELDCVIAKSSLERGIICFRVCSYSSTYKDQLVTYFKPKAYGSLGILKGLRLKK
jgi:hypothetical protein